MQVIVPARYHGLTMYQYVTWILPAEVSIKFAERLDSRNLEFRTNILPKNTSGDDVRGVTQRIELCLRDTQTCSIRWVWVLSYVHGDDSLSYQKFYPWGCLHEHVWREAESQFHFGAHLFDSVFEFLRNYPCTP